MDDVKKILCRLAALAALASCSPGALAASYSALYSFGDSFSDTGNLFGGLTALPPEEALAYWPPLAIPGYTDGFYNGRPSNGPVAAEYLAGALGLAGGFTNYAYTGALSGRGNVLPFVDTAIGATGLRDQVDTYLSGAGAAGADPDALYFVWGGHNDFWGLGQALPASMGDEARQDLFEQAALAGAQNIADDVNTLIGAGAKNILVVNSVALEYEPFWDAFAATDPTLRSLIHDGVTTMNSRLDALLGDMQAGMPGANIMGFDAQGWYEDTIARVLGGEEVGGLTNASAACFGYDGAQFAACAEPEEYLFWDSIHLTTTAYAMLGAEFASTVGVSAPVPEPAAWVLFIGGLLPLLWRRRQPWRAPAANTTAYA